jgi:betaine-homocysteine S-methyltransferase
MKGILERLADGVVLGAEGYLFEMERRGYVKAGPYVPEAVLDYPQAVAELHREFLLAGAEVMVAFTYYAHKEKMRTIGREADLERLNRQALQIARTVAKEGDALLAGNISNSWVYDPEEPEASGMLVRDMYRDQVRWSVEEGADFIIAETIEYVGEAVIALEVIQEFNLPSMVTFASSGERTVDGYALADACYELEQRGANIVGLNCTRGPDTMVPIIQQIRDRVKCYVAAQPVPYHTTPQQPTFQSLKSPDGQCNRFEMGDFAAAAKAMGVNYIGICCGGAPHHVRSMAERLGRTVPASRYSPDMSLHPILGTGNFKDKEKFQNWRD